MSPSSTPSSWNTESLTALLAKAPEESRSLLELVYYGSSDDRELGLIKSFRDASHSAKKRSMVLTSVIGGLSCLNVIVALKPKRLYFFDANPMQLLLFEMVRRVILTSRDKQDFLLKIRRRNYRVHSNWEQELQNNLSIKMALDEGIQSERKLCGLNRRPLERSWRYGLNRFEKLKRILLNTPLTLLIEDTRNEDFVDFLLRQPNHWIYLSNIWEMSSRLQQSTNKAPPSPTMVGEDDTILMYSRPYVIKFRRFERLS
ncbi:MAG: hypothetical protein IIB00_06415 [candidate division Zixibacteria bacterium]|nr:hypothetical protein [candidate division Zixibacteria bacterium]